MESLIRITLLTIFTSLICTDSYANAGYLYFSRTLGHLHKAPSKDSSSLTVIQCSHSIRVLVHAKKIPYGWIYTQVGEDKGFVESKFLSDKKPDCFQGRYPRFYNSMELDITDMYFWGKLNTRYIEGTSKIK